MKPSKSSVPRRRYIPVVIVICVGILLSVASFYIIRHLEFQELKTRFSLDSQNRINAVKREIETALETLQGLHSLYLSSEEVTKSEFQKFTKSSLLKHKGIQALGWIPRVSRSERETFEQLAQADGFPGFRITERESQGKMVRAGEKNEYFPVYFIEPYKGNEAAMGFDMASNPVRLKALNKSRNTGDMSATARITLVQEKEKQNGFLVFSPVYRADVKIDNVEHQRGNLLGFVLGAFRIGDIVKKSYNYLQPKGIDVYLFDESAPQSDRLLYTHLSRLQDDRRPVIANDQDNFVSQTFNVADRKWSIITKPTPEYLDQLEDWHSWGIAISLLLITGMLAFYLKNNLNRTIYIEQLMDKLSREVAEREKSEARISLAEQAWRNTFDSITDFVSVIDLDFRIVKVNKAFAGFLGKKEAELNGQHCFRVFHGLDEPFPGCPHKEMLETKQAVTREIYEPKFGLHMIITASPLFEDGKLKGSVHFVKDISARKKTELALKESRERYSNLFHYSNDAIVLHNLRGDILDVNQKCLDMFGYSSLEIKSMKIQDLHPAETLNKSKKAFETILQRGFVNFEIDCRKKDSRVFPAEVSSSLFEIGGETVIQGLVRDISERKAAEKALRFSEEKFSKAFRSSPAFITISTLKEGRFIDVNNAFLKESGYSREEVIGHTAGELQTWVDPADREKVVHDLLKYGEVSNFETGIRIKSGAVHTVLWSGEIIDIGGEQCIIAVSLDIADRKKLESQLMHAQKMEAVGQLAGGVAHDFNNILTAIISYTHLLKIKLDTEHEQHDSIDKILALSDRASQITRGLLTFSRKQHTEFKPINLNALVRNVEKILAQFIGEDIEISTAFTDKEPTIMADWSQIEQVLMNLATNARDSMPGGGSLTISTDVVELDRKFVDTHGYGKPGTYALLTVSDTGLGMDQETCEKIFEPFFTTKEVGKGTGLGLAIIYGIIKQHGGYITVYSELEQGTIFRIYIKTSGGAVQEEKKTDLTGLAGKGEYILLTEDEGAVRNSIKNILEEFKYNVIEAVDGKDAVEKYAANSDIIQLVILDVVMPRMNGKEVYTEIKKLRPDIRVIFTSGYTADILQKKKVIEEEVVLLSKPVTPADLLSKIKEVLAPDNK